MRNRRSERLRQRPTRRALGAALAGVLLLAGVTAGCGPAIEEDAAAYPTEVDVARAQLAWSDPWVAGTVTTVASGPNLDRVDNRVALRAYSAPREARDLLAGEVGDAQQNGWRLIAASCPAQGPAAALLTRGSDPDDGLIAQVTVSNNNSTTPSGQTATNSDVLVKVYTAFHAQTQWPTMTPTTFDVGCPADDDGTSTQRPLPALAGLIGRDLRLDGPTPDGPQEWPTAKPEASFDDAAAATDVYRLFVRTGVPNLDSGLDWASPKLTLPHGSSTVQYADFSKEVEGLTRDGWQLTFTSCSGRTQRTIAELSNYLVDDHRTVVQLQWSEQRPDTSPKVGTPAWRGTLNVAVVASPAPSPVATPCWDKGGKPRGATFVASGTPSFGPVEIWPIQGMGP